MPSLQDQLLKAGLADEKKAKAIRNEKHKSANNSPRERLRSMKRKFVPARHGKRKQNGIGN